MGGCILWIVVGPQWRRACTIEIPERGRSRSCEVPAIDGPFEIGGGRWRSLDEIAPAQSDPLTLTSWGANGSTNLVFGLFQKPDLD
jgi:hypothetical protein